MRKYLFIASLVLFVPTVSVRANHNTSHAGKRNTGRQEHRQTGKRQ